MKKIEPFKATKPEIRMELSLSDAKGYDNFDRRLKQAFEKGYNYEPEPIEQDKFISIMDMDNVVPANRMNRARHTNDFLFPVLWHRQKLGSKSNIFDCLLRGRDTQGFYLIVSISLGYHISLSRCRCL